MGNDEDPDSPTSAGFGSPASPASPTSPKWDSSEILKEQAEPAQTDINEVAPDMERQTLDGGLSASSADQPQEAAPQYDEAAAADAKQPELMQDSMKPETLEEENPNQRRRDPWGPAEPAVRTRSKRHQGLEIDTGETGRRAQALRE